MGGVGLVPPREEVFPALCSVMLAMLLTDSARCILDACVEGGQRSVYSLCYTHTHTHTHTLTCAWYRAASALERATCLLASSPTCLSAASSAEREATCARQRDSSSCRTRSCSVSCCSCSWWEEACCSSEVSSVVWLSWKCWTWPGEGGRRERGRERGRERKRG